MLLVGVLLLSFLVHRSNGNVSAFGVRWISKTLTLPVYLWRYRAAWQRTKVMCGYVPHTHTHTHTHSPAVVVVARLMQSDISIFVCFYLKTLGLSLRLSGILKCSEAEALTFSTWSESEPSTHTHTHTHTHSHRLQSSTSAGVMQRQKNWLCAEQYKENKTFVSAAIFSHDPVHQSPSKITCEIKESDTQ